jgi:hypothetical protein
MAGNNTFGIPYLRFGFLSMEVADTGRRDLLPGEVRRGGTGADKNDDLVLFLVQTRGHVILKRIVWRMNENPANNMTEIQNVAACSSLFAYKTQRSRSTQPCTILRQNSDRNTNPLHQPVIAAIRQVFQEDDEGILFLTHMMSVEVGKKNVSKGQRRSGMFSCRLALLSRKFWERCIDAARRPLPAGVILQDGRRLPLRVVDNRTDNEKATGENIRQLSRLMPEREDLLIHEFPKLVLTKLKAIIMAEVGTLGIVPDEEDEQRVRLMAWEEVNAMFGWGLDGYYWMTREQTDGSTSYYYRPNVAKAMKEAYEEFFDDTVDEDSWREFCQNKHHVRSPEELQHLNAQR